MSDCLFCRVISGEIKGSIVHQDKDLVAISDINPQAPLHVLIMPRQHIATINDLTPANDALVGSMFRAAAALAKQNGYAERGYRTGFNCNSEAGQSGFHIHLHLLAGRPMARPPGWGGVGGCGGWGSGFGGCGPPSRNPANPRGPGNRQD